MYHCELDWREFEHSLQTFTISERRHLLNKTRTYSSNSIDKLMYHYNQLMINV